MVLCISACILTYIPVNSTLFSTVKYDDIPNKKIRQLEARYNFAKQVEIHRKADLLTEQIKYLLKSSKKTIKSIRKEKIQKANELVNKRKAMIKGDIEQPHGLLFNGTSPKILSIGYVDNIFPIAIPFERRHEVINSLEVKSYKIARNKDEAHIKFHKIIDKDYILISYNFYIDIVLKTRTRNMKIPNRPIKRDVRSSYRHPNSPITRRGKNNDREKARERERKSFYKFRNKIRNKIVRYGPWSKWTETRQPIRIQERKYFAVKGLNDLYENGVTFDMSKLNDICFYYSSDTIRHNGHIYPVLKPIKLETFSKIK